MPSITIHEEVGYYISKKINIDSYDYYLGIIAPDSPNLEGLGPKEERWAAHIRRKDLKEWRKQIKKFYESEKNNYPKDFLLGYYIHILTDIIYDDYIYKKVKTKIINDNHTSLEAHEVMSKDMNNYYFPEIEIIKKKLLQNNVTYNINNISKKLLLEWKKKQANILINDNKSIYITNDIIEELNIKVYDELKLLLCINNIY